MIPVDIVDVPTAVGEPSPIREISVHALEASIRKPKRKQKRKEAETQTTTLQNLNAHDPFEDANDGQIQDRLINIRIQQINVRKTLTSVQGLSSDYDLKKIVKACKKEFGCNRTVIEHPEYGEVIQLQVDQRENICIEYIVSYIVSSIDQKISGRV